MTKKIMCGAVQIGGGAPISIQSMTNTDTRNIKNTIEQIKRLEEAGCEIVRLAVPDEEAADAIAAIKKGVSIPIVADIHFDYKLAIAAIKNGADKVRINPGNIGGRDRIKAVVDSAKERGIPIRVGVNSGSLEQDILIKYGKVTAEALAESALRNAEILSDLNFEDIVISIKSSDVKLNYEAHKIIREKTEYPLHIGITESGTAVGGKVKSAIGIGSLILAGIGDTMRVSLTGDPVKEITLAREILSAMGMFDNGINLIACPTCGRTKVDLAYIAEEIEKALKPIGEKRRKLRLKGLDVAVMGCAVNGPGEAREADFGVACGEGKALIFEKGKPLKTVVEADIIKEIVTMAENHC